MRNQTVLVTRPEPDAALFAGALKEHGLTPLVSPLMEIEFDEARPFCLEGVSAIAFTSANGVRAVAGRVGLDRSLPVFAVGALTAREAKEAGFDDVRVASGDVTTLADLIAADQGYDREGVISHVAGSHRAGDLVSLLAAREVPVRRDVLYEAKAVTSLRPDLVRRLQEAPPEWAAFFSPRTARLFMKLIEDAGCLEAIGQMRAACLSPQIAAALPAAHWADIQSARQTSAQALIDLIKTQ